MLSIIKVRFQGLWNSEYPLVVNRLIDIVERYNPHSIHLGVSFDRLAAFRTALSKIDVQERADSESAALSELDQQRDTPLVNGVNRLNAYYKQQLAARATRRKAKQAVEKEKEIAPYEGKEYHADIELEKNCKTMIICNKNVKTNVYINR